MKSSRLNERDKIMSLIVMMIVVALLAGILQGVTGFGAGIVMMIFLPTQFALIQSAGISTAICIVLCALMAYRYRKVINFKEIIIPAILYLGVSSCAIIFSKMVDQDLMKKVFGVFLVILAIYYLFFNKQTESKLNILMKLGCIVVSGLCDGLFGIGGPLMVLYFLNQTTSKEEYLGTIQTFFLINVTYNTIFRITNGIITMDHLSIILIGMLGIIIGFVIANKIVDRLDGEIIKKITYVVIGISGIINLI